MAASSRESAAICRLVRATTVKTRTQFRMNLELLVRLIIFHRLFPTDIQMDTRRIQIQNTREDVQIEKVLLALYILRLHVKERVQEYLYFRY